MRRLGFHEELTSLGCYLRGFFFFFGWGGGGGGGGGGRG